MLNKLLIGVFLLAGPGSGFADDWPLAGGNAARTHSTPEDLPASLTLQWTWRGAHPPQPAWPSSDRLSFDRADSPVVAGGVVAFGSSAEGKVTALDAATGRLLWSMFTGGPVRFAPAAWRDRFFVASDDGHLYALRAATGDVLWKIRGGPDDRMILGNDRVISHWPARGGPVVADEVVYFAAGIWPSDGIYLYALDAATGKVLWCNDTSGSIYMPQPHGGANAESGVAAQGALVVAGDLLLVPTGRSVPAAFRRSDGVFQYFHLQENGQQGGASVSAMGALFFNHGVIYDLATGAAQEAVGAGVFAASPGGVARSTERTLSLCAIRPKEKKNKKGDLVRITGLEELWSLSVPGGVALISAGAGVVVGAPRRVTLVDAVGRKVLWSAAVDGLPYALAVAEGRLYVGTDQGLLYCFGAPLDVARKPPLAPRMEAAPAGPGGAAAASATEIVAKTGVIEGYAVDLGCGDGALAFDLARLTKLRIYAIDADPAKVAVA